MASKLFRWCQGKKIYYVFLLNNELFCYGTIMQLYALFAFVSMFSIFLIRICDLFSNLYIICFLICFHHASWDGYDWELLLRVFGNQTNRFEVLESVYKLSADIIKVKDPEFTFLVHDMRVFNDTLNNLTNNAMNYSISIIHHFAMNTNIF
ncbi:hypothetical protein ACJX0J_013901, partial [Zea mays]